MDNKYFLRIENKIFRFVTEDINQIKESDTPIKESDYKLFFELQSQGKQFRVKENPTGTGLFDYIEEYTPEVIEKVQEPGLEEMLLDHEYRLSKVELGV